MYTVLGSRGFIGSRVLATLEAQGHDCYAPLRGDEAVFSNPLGHVFYCIGLTNDYKDRPFDTVEAHSSFISRLLASGNFERLVYLSSTRLYDGLKTAAESADLVLNPANPRHLYDFSKGLGENLCLTASGGRACVARLSSVYDDGPDASGFMPDLLRRLKKERTFALGSASGIVRDYVHIDDVVNGLIRLLDSTETGIVNIASGENVSNQEIVDALNKEGCAITLQRQSPLEAPALCDVSKLKALGVSPVNLRDYLKNFVKG